MNQQYFTPPPHTHTPKINGRYNHIDFMEFSAILFVLIYHSLYITNSMAVTINFLDRASFFAYIDYFFTSLLSTCVPIFFFCNGFLLFNKPICLKIHICKTLRMVILTVLWAAISLILIMLIEKTEWSFNTFLNDLWNMKFLWTNQLWFICALVCIYLIFPLLKIAFDTHKNIFLYFTSMCAIFTFGNKFLIMVISIFYYLFRDSAINVDINLFHQFNPFRGIRGYSFVYFCVGGLIGLWHDKILCYMKRKKLLINTLAIIILLISCMSLTCWGIFYSTIQSNLHDIVWNGYDTIFTFINVISIYFLSLNYHPKADFFSSKLIRLISNNTIGIFFMHYIFMHLFFQYFKIKSYCNSMVFNVIFALATLCSSVFTAYLLKKIPIINQLFNYNCKKK